jgi:hypothetical protein
MLEILYYKTLINNFATQKIRRLYIKNNLYNIIFKILVDLSPDVRLALNQWLYEGGD